MSSLLTVAGYPVIESSGWEDDRLIGLVTLTDARSIDPVEREAYTVEEVMTTDLETITPESNAMEAIEKMRDNDIGRLLVVDNGDLIGLISRSDLMTAFDIVQKSGAIDPSQQPRTAD